MATLSWRDRISLLKAAAFPQQQAQQAALILNRIQGSQIGEPPARGAQGMLESYAEMPWVRAVAGRVAGSMAAVEWRLYKAVAKGRERAIKAPDLQFSGYTERKSLIQQRRESGELVEIKEHLLLTALTKGNGFHTGVALRRLTQLSLDLVGETFWLKARNGLNAPVAFWPIPATWVQDTPTPAKPTFRISHRGWNEDIPQSEIAWISDPNPADPYGRGVGFMHSLSDEAEIDEYAAKTARQMFFNKAAPDFLVYPKSSASDPSAEMSLPEVKRFETDWLNRLQGYWKSYKPYFLSREVGVYEFAKDMQALQLGPIRNQERDIILQVFGAPPEKFGILNNSNRSTIDASDLIWAKDVLVPRLEFWRSYFQERLVPEYDDRLIIDYVTPVMEDRDFALKAAQFAPWAMDGNEWRALMGHSPKEEFDGVYFVPPAVTPVSADQLTTDLRDPDRGDPDEVPPPKDMT